MANSDGYVGRPDEGDASQRLACHSLYAALKRSFDVVLAAAGLVLLSPLFLLIASAIKLDSGGPVLFRQSRHGRDEQTFSVYKFRSMCVMENGDAFRQVRKNDPRVTRVGRFLRRTNLDELPQLLNVLVGEMSIVGPRPQAIAHNRMFSDIIPAFSRRHSVRPGLTGWAQANGFRGETDTIDKMARRVDHDLHYIDHWSLWLDLKIVMMTLVSLRVYHNAY